MVGNAESEFRDSVEGGKHIPPTDLVAFLPYACEALQTEIILRMHVHSQEEYVSRSKPQPRARSKSVARWSAPAHPAGRAGHFVADVSSDDAAYADGHQQPDNISIHAVPIIATLDPLGHVIEIEVVRVCVPLALVQVLALAAPFNPMFARIVLRGCSVRGAIVHELLKPAFDALTDICLDDSRIPEANYTTLLDNDRLRRLSLARIGLDDDGCAELALRLHNDRPAGRSLRLLDLTSNAIGDTGAGALAHALRSNRTLLHLNLAGNRVSDDGAAELLRVFTPFPLTTVEVTEVRQRRLAHLRVLRAETAFCFSELVAERDKPLIEDATRGRRRGMAPSRGGATSSRRASLPVEDLEERAAMRALTLVGSFNDPFAPTERINIEGHPYSSGNRVLCYLNLAHNTLTVLTAKRLAYTLHNQRKSRRASLLRVVLDGNPLPCAGESQHMTNVEELLERAIWAAAQSDLIAPRRMMRSTIRNGR